MEQGSGRWEKKYNTAQISLFFKDPAKKRLRGGKRERIVPGLGGGKPPAPQGPRKAQKNRNVKEPWCCGGPEKKREENANLPKRTKKKKGVAKKHRIWGGEGEKTTEKKIGKKKSVGGEEKVVYRLQGRPFDAYLKGVKGEKEKRKIPGEKVAGENEEKGGNKRGVHQKTNLRLRP